MFSLDVVDEAAQEALTDMPPRSEEASNVTDQLQFSLSVSHQRYIIQYGEFGNR